MITEISENNKWSKFFEKYSVGDRIIGNIQTINDSGIFVGLAGGIDGLVCNSELSWTIKYHINIKAPKIGDAVEVMILELDQERPHIGLSIKQCFNPFNEFFEKY